MASGKTHLLVAIAAAPVVSVAAFTYGWPIEEAVAYGALELIAGSVLSPDLDTECMYSKFWLGAWIPYRDALAHRSLWSHGPVIGTLGRLLYLAALLSLLCFILMSITWGFTHHTFDPLRQVSSVSDLWQSGWASFSWQQKRDGFIAMEIGSMLHVAGDFISTSWKTKKIFSFRFWFSGAHYPNVGRKQKSRRVAAAA